MKQFLLFLFVMSLFASCQNTPKETITEDAQVPNTSDHKAKYTDVKPVIDGFGNDQIWSEVEWYPIDQLWIGNPVNADDFEGRFKLAWNKDFLYILAEIKDDVLMDIHEDGLVQYWDDDCLEIFIDEDRSKGLHQFSHNAFAYHIGLDYSVTDFGPDSMPHYYNDHLICKRTMKNNVYTWEVAMSVYNDQYKDGEAMKSETLSKGKTMGFAIAYCDNDKSLTRENFYGSIFVPGEDKNRGYIDAGIFGELILE
ncbi:MAG: sugar-binding protein [Bacteroidota bacterium]